MRQLCPRCGRPSPPCSWYDHAREASAVRVVHAHYGCDTGCCGHEVQGLDAGGNICSRSFAFSHPYGEPKETFVTHLAREFYPNESVAILMQESEAIDECH